MQQRQESRSLISHLWSSLNFNKVEEKPTIIQPDFNTPESPSFERRISCIYKCTTFAEAIEKEDEAAFEHLLQDDPKGVTARGSLGECLIHKLFMKGADAHNNMVKLLVKRYPNTIIETYNGAELYGATALHVAIVKGNTAMVEWLLGDEHNVAYREQLLNAVATGTFFKKGRPCYYGETPLAFACANNKWDIVEILLKYGASMDVVDSYENNILHLLVIHSLPEMYTKFKQRWIEENKENQVQTHDDEDCDEDDSESKAQKVVPLWKRYNKDGYTPLTLAARSSLYDMFSFLLDEHKITQWSFGPVSCVLYPLDQVDLSFHDDNDHNGVSALETIVQNALVKLIMHPRMVDLVDKKWERFAKRIFFRRFFVALCYFSIFLITTILDQMREEKIEGTDEDAVVTNVTPPGMLCQVICTIGRLFVLGGAINKGHSEMQELIKLGYKKYFHTTGAGLLENYLSCLFCLTIYLVNIARVFGSDIESLFLAMAAIFGWGYMLFFVMAFRVTGPFIVMIYQMLFNDVLRFFIIYAVFFIGFSQAFFVLFNYNGFSGFIISLKQSFLGLLGDFDLDTYVEVKYSFISVCLLLIYIVVVTILLLNLLVAMMGDTYGKIVDDATEVWQLERARIVFAIENEMEDEERSLEKNKYWTDVKGRRYLQVQEVNNAIYNIKKKQDDAGDADNDKDDDKDSS